MNQWQRIAGCGALIVFVFSSAAWSQQTAPHVAYVYPAGGQRGTTFRVVVGGRNLGRYSAPIRRVYFSGSGVRARVLGRIEPISSAEAGKLRGRLAELRRRRPEQMTADTQMEIARLERKLATYMAQTTRRRTQPNVGEAVELEVTIDSDAQPGVRQMRVESEGGASNAVRFIVDVLPEFREAPPPINPPPAEFRGLYRFPPLVRTDVVLPAVANGQIIPREPDYVNWQVRRFTPGEADRYRFSARRGQRLVIAAQARQLIPYLADAVPGWFQATLTLYDADGNELAYCDDYRFDPDPVIFFEVPRDGQYIVEIKDAIYRGRPDFVYRIRMGQLPFITSIFPLGGRAGQPVRVKLAGWNLPAEAITVDTTDKPPGIYPVSVQAGGVPSNTVPFAVDTLPETFEREPNDTVASAQPAALPVIVNGRIDRPGDWDVFQIEGRAGQPVVAEVIARRLDSPLNSVLELTDAAGKRLAFNDDHQDMGDPLHTHHADSLIHVTLPADGRFFVRLGDAAQEGGPEYAYRLRLSPPRPDFQLRVVPAWINANTWQLTPVTVYAIRKDGFAGDIALSLRSDPPGVWMDGGLVPAGQERVRVTLALPWWLGSGRIKLRMEGRATIGGKEVVRTAVPADEWMQAFAYKHLVPARELIVVLTGRRQGRKPPADPRSFRPPLQVLSQLPVRIPAGGTADVQAHLSWDTSRGEYEFELSEPPEGISIEAAQVGDRTATIRLHADGSRTKPGLRGNLIIVGFQKRSEKGKDGQVRRFRSFMGPLPAIPFEITGP